MFKLCLGFLVDTLFSLVSEFVVVVILSSGYFILVMVGADHCGHIPVSVICFVCI